MTKHVYLWSCSVKVVVTNKNTDESRTLSKASYSKKMTRQLQEALQKSFTSRNGLASFVSKEYQKRITSIICTFDESEKELRIDVSTNTVLSAKDIKYVEKFLSGQLSDGWGEGFEQIPFYETKTMDYQMFSLSNTLKHQRHHEKR